MIPYEGAEINGPYIREDGYYRITIKYPSGYQTVTGYARYLMEVHLGRYLESDEDVHHKDKNLSNNEIENLIVMNRRDHEAIHTKIPLAEAWICAHCGDGFIASPTQVRDRRTKIKCGKILSGPYCGRACANKGRTLARNK